MDLGGLQSLEVFRAVGAWTPELHGSPAPITSIARFWRPLKLDKTMIRCIGLEGSDWMNGAWSTENLDGHSRNEDCWRQF